MSPEQHPHGLADLYAGRGGIYRGPVAAANLPGWRAYAVRAGDKAALLAALAEEMHLPGYFGRNLDALWDALTDLTEPTAVLWAGWADLAVDHPRDWAIVLDLFGERARLAPAFALVLV